jgi:riboflavin transporter FmnP
MKKDTSPLIERGITMQNRSRRGQNPSVAKRITLAAVFAALAFSTMFFFRFNVTFLTFDLKDTMITLLGLLTGPVSALTVSFLVAMLEFVVDSDTGWYGLIMNFASSATFSVVCATLYRYRKTLTGAIVGLITAVLALIAVMMLLNIFVTPVYAGVPRGQIIAMLPTLFLPFNAIKGVVNAALVLILYKPIRRAIGTTKLLPRAYLADEHPDTQKKRIWVSVTVSVVGIALLIGAIAVFIVVLHGQITMR